jgi:AcrR family transcriptional regulator
MDVKLRILKETGIMFSKYGIRSITMEHIASELGISKRTLYEKFEDKDDLILQAIEEGTKVFKKHCFEIVDNSDNIIDAIFKIAKVNNDLFSKINQPFVF